MAFNANTATVGQWLAIAPLCGLPVANFVPTNFQAQAQAAAQRNVPAGIPVNSKARFVTQATAMLIARGIIYFKAVPGDCGRATPIGTGESQGEQAAVAGISAMAGAALPGIGPFINAIAGIFGAAHAAAVAKEQTTICQVAGVINQVFAYYDAQVRTGKISPSTAYAGIQNFMQQVSEQLQTIEQTCNAACWTQGFLAAHSDFVEYYYPAIAPPSIFPGVPGGIVYDAEEVLGAPLNAVGIKTTPTELIVGLGLLAILLVVVLVPK